MHTSQPNSPTRIAPITLVIVNWNSADVLSKCLEHVLAQTVLPNRVLVMDNGSDDDSLKYVPNDERFEIHLLGNNLGFAAANNRALSLCETEYVALLNPDAFVLPDWLECLMEAVERYPQIAAFASLQLFNDNPNIIDGVGDSYHASGLVWRDKHGATLQESDKLDQPIFAPCAAAALYRRQALDDVGGFDEDFFCYVEDVDLGFRLRLAGHDAMLVGSAVVHHVGSATTGGQHSDFCVYHGHRNLVWTFIKNMPGILFWLFLPLHLLLNLATIGYFGMKGQGRIILKAKFDAITGTPKMWQKRKVIQSKRIAPIRDIWCALDKGFGRLSPNGK